MSVTLAWAPAALGSAVVVSSSRTKDFSTFVAENQSALLSFAHLVCGTSVQAEDVLQEVLARAYLKWDRIGAADMDTRAYLNRMVINERNSLWRRAFRRHEWSTDEVPETGVEDPSGDDATWEQVLKLPPRQRQVVAMRFYADMSVAETAAALRCSEGTVKSQTHHALNTLRAALAQQELQEAHDAR